MKKALVTALIIAAGSISAADLKPYCKFAVDGEVAENRINEEMKVDFQDKDMIFFLKIHNYQEYSAIYYKKTNLVAFHIQPQYLDVFAPNVEPPARSTSLQDLNDEFSDLINGNTTYKPLKKITSGDFRFGPVPLDKRDNDGDLFASGRPGKKGANINVARVIYNSETYMACGLR